MPPPSPSLVVLPLKTASTAAAVMKKAVTIKKAATIKKEKRARRKPAPLLCSACVGPTGHQCQTCVPPPFGRSSILFGP